MLIQDLIWICKEFGTDYPIFSTEEDYIVMNIPTEVTKKQKKRLEGMGITKEEDGYWTYAV